MAGMTNEPRTVNEGIYTYLLDTPPTSYGIGRCHPNGIGGTSHVITWAKGHKLRLHDARCFAHPDAPLTQTTRASLGRWLLLPADFADGLAAHGRAKAKAKVDALVEAGQVLRLRDLTPGQIIYPNGRGSKVPHGVKVLEVERIKGGKARLAFTIPVERVLRSWYGARLVDATTGVGELEATGTILARLEPLGRTSTPAEGPWASDLAAELEVIAAARATAAADHHVAAARAELSATRTARIAASETAAENAAAAWAAIASDAPTHVLEQALELLVSHGNLAETTGRPIAAELERRAKVDSDDSIPEAPADEPEGVYTTGDAAAAVSFWRSTILTQADALEELEPARVSAVRRLRTIADHPDRLRLEYRQRLAERLARIDTVDALEDFYAVEQAQAVDPAANPATRGLAAWALPVIRLELNFRREHHDAAWVTVENLEEGDITVRRRRMALEDYGIPGRLAMTGRYVVDHVTGPSHRGEYLVGVHYSESGVAGGGEAFTVPAGTRLPVIGAV